MGELTQLSKERDKCLFFVNMSLSVSQLFMGLLRISITQRLHFKGDYSVERDRSSFALS